MGHFIPSLAFLVFTVGLLEKTSASELLVEANKASDITFSCDLENFPMQSDQRLQSLQLLKVESLTAVIVLAEVDVHGEKTIKDPLYIIKDRVYLEAKLNGSSSFLNLTLPSMWPNDWVLGKYRCKVTYDLKNGLKALTWNETFDVCEGDCDGCEDKPNKHFRIQTGLSLTCADRRRADLCGKAKKKGYIRIDDNNDKLASVQFLDSSGTSCASENVKCWSSVFSEYAKVTAHVFNAENKTVEDVWCIASVESNKLNKTFAPSAVPDGVRSHGPCNASTDTWKILSIIYLVLNIALTVTVN